MHYFVVVQVRLLDLLSLTHTVNVLTILNLSGKVYVFRNDPLLSALIVPNFAALPFALFAFTVNSWLFAKFSPETVTFLPSNLAVSDPLLPVPLAMAG